MANYGPIGNNPGYVTKTATAISSTNIPASMNGKSAQFVLNNPTPWQITSVSCVCVSSATVGTRQLGLVISDSNSLPVLNCGEGNVSNLTQTASTSVFYTFGSSMPAGNTNTQFASATLPYPCIIPPFSILQFVDRTQTDVADTVTFQVSYLV